jgi:hypothetical protein
MIVRAVNREQRPVARVEIKEDFSRYIYGTETKK